MIQRGRKSAAAASVVQIAATPRRPRLTPPPTLSIEEQSTFNALLSDNPHLSKSEPLLMLYVLALSKAVKLARGKDVAAWEKAVRLALSVGTKLRITPQSTQDPQALGRRKADHRNFPEQQPWYADLDEIERSRPSVDFRSEAQRLAGERFPGNPPGDK
jgi:hypothetical protein